MGRLVEKYPRCAERGKCFAKTEEGTCEILHAPNPHDYSKPPFKRGKCPFRKPDREITNGKRYPIDPNYNPNER